MATKPKLKRSAPVPVVSAKQRVRQFPEDLYEDGGILFCKFCSHSLDFTRLDTIKDHLKSQKHKHNKLSHSGTRTNEKENPTASSSRQVTLTSLIGSKDLREEFILDFVKMCTMADISLEKTDKMTPFLLKHCRQGGALPKGKSMRQVYVQRLFHQHYASLKQLFRGVPISIIADETTDSRDHSIMNIVFAVLGKCYLVDVARLHACNHATMSQAIIRAVTTAGVGFDQINAVVTDSAAYCKKAYREVLSAVFPQSKQVLCMAHIFNLVGEVFQHWGEFSRIASLLTMVKSAFFKKPGRKARYLTYLAEYLPQDKVALPPIPVSTRWNSWFKSVCYHAEHIHVYEGFFKAEKSEGMAVENILTLTHKSLLPEMLLYLSFLSESSQLLMTSLTKMEATHDTLACEVYNVAEDLRQYLTYGTTKQSFGEKTDFHLAKLKPTEKSKVIKSFRAVFSKALKKLEMHIDNHPAYQVYKATRIFDPRQLPTLSHNIDDYTAIPELQAPTNDVLQEWQTYVGYRNEDIVQPLNIHSFWESLATNRYPNLGQVALKAIWFPVASVDVERSFSSYKHILNDRRESLTDENMKQLIMLYFNGDIEGRFN